MKIRLLTPSGNKEIWYLEARSLYLKKIQAFTPIELIESRSEKSSRGKSQQKKESDSKGLIRELNERSHSVLLDETGRVHTSKSLANWLQSRMNSGVKQIDFVVGGAYGVTDEVKTLTKEKISLSSMTLNHTLAQIVLLEQLFRSFSILKGLPYHNE